MEVTQTKKWLENVVIGLNLCPFAKHPFQSDNIRYVVHKGDDLKDLSEILVAELQSLAQKDANAVETTLIIIANALPDFLEYLDYTEIAEHLLVALNLEGIIQVATFHPAYQFAETKPDDVENYTNRSPYPMLHLIKESNISWAVENHPDIDSIPETNIRLMKELGIEKVKTLMN